MLRRENDGNDTLLFPGPFKRTHILVCERSDIILNHSEAPLRRHVNPHSLSLSGAKCQSDDCRRAHEAGRGSDPGVTRITRINANFWRESFNRKPACRWTPLELGQGNAGNDTLRFPDPFIGDNLATIVAKLFIHHGARFVANW